MFSNFVLISSGSGGLFIFKRSTVDYFDIDRISSLSVCHKTDSAHAVTQTHANTHKNMQTVERTAKLLFNIHQEEDGKRGSSALCVCGDRKSTKTRHLSPTRVIMPYRIAWIIHRQGSARSSRPRCPCLLLINGIRITTIAAGLPATTTNCRHHRLITFFFLLFFTIHGKQRESLADALIR